MQYFIESDLAVGLNFLQQKNLTFFAIKCLTKLSFFLIMV